MKVLKDGKEVKDATVAFDAAGNPVHVNVKGIDYALAGFKLEDSETQKKNKEAPSAKAKATKK